MRFRPGLRALLLCGLEPEWLKIHPRREYVKAVTLSMLPWVNRARVRRIYAYARFKTIMTGQRYVVDHIVPVVHPYVCGLSTPENLQVISHGANSAKTNKFHPDQLSLF